MQRFGVRLLPLASRQIPLLASRQFSVSSFRMVSQFKIKAPSSSLKDGDKVEVEVEGVEEGKVLLLKVQGELRAVGSKCTHYGAPLVKGVLGSDGRLTCPWHGACFNTKNGDIEDAPAIDNITVYPITEKNGDMFIEGTEENIKGGGRRVPQVACAAASADHGSVVIVGGGSGATGALEGLRENGFKGSVTVLSKENYTAIDRTKLSKALISDPSKIALRDAGFYKSANVTFETDATVTDVDLKKKTVTTEGGKSYPYTHLILATGGTPKKLPMDGFKDLKNIFTLRTISDVKDILTAVGDTKKKNITIVGSSFIGMEIANALVKDNQVTVVGQEKVPLERVLGEQVGGVIRKKVEGSGVKFFMDASVSHAEPSKSDSSKVGAVLLKDGTSIASDLVVLGVGVGPETSYLKSSGLDLEEDKSLKVNSTFSVPGYEGEVFAIGDIATYPYHGPGGKADTYVRIEHWNVAQNAGRVVAKTITDPDRKDVKLFIPVFWSALGAQLRYAGHTPDGFDEVYFDGDEKEAKFVAYYGKKDEVVAIATMGRDPYNSMAAQLMFQGLMPSFSKIKAGTDIVKMGHSVGLEAKAE